LKYNIEHVLNTNKHGILTFGGAFSNHLHAVAAAGKIFDIKTIGVIRGEPTLPLNPTLSFCLAKEMKLIYWRRADYQKKNLKEKADLLHQKHKSYELIPEGGSNALALKGVGELWKKYPLDVFDHICLPIGTAGTLKGIIEYSNNNNHIIGFSALKFNIQKQIENYFTAKHIQFNNWEINNQYHFGGYVKHSNKLIDFINSFNEKHNIQLDPLYTGKMMFGIFDLAAKNYFKKGSTILAIHTGGQQGIAGFNKRFGDIIKTTETII